MTLRLIHATCRSADGVATAGSPLGIRRAPQAPDPRYDLLSRFTSSLLVFGITLRSFLWDFYRSARRRSRLTFGAAAVALAAVIGVTVGLLTGSPAPAGAASAPGTTRNAAAAGRAPHSQHAPGQHGPNQKVPQHLAVQHGVAQHGAAQKTAVQPAAQPAAQPAVPAVSARPYKIYDSVTPSAIPAHHSAAVYANGLYAATASQLRGRGSVLWIDATGGDPSASVLDVEPGDASPSTAAWWAWQKLHSNPSGPAIIYTMRSEWPAVRHAIHTLPSQMRSHVRYWIADPTGVEHVVPGSDATQWYWGSKYDITTANPGFLRA